MDAAYGLHLDVFNVKDSLKVTNPKMRFELMPLPLQFDNIRHDCVIMSSGNMPTLQSAPCSTEYAHICEFVGEFFCGTKV